MPKLRMLLALALALAATALVAACGDDDSGDQTSAAQVDGAFITAMIPHHEGAVEMAESAQQNAEHPQIRELAANIIATQSEEIAQLEQAHRRLFDAEVGEMDHGPGDEMMGSSGMMGGASGMPGDPSMMRNAKQFDKAFIDMMIPHHRSAIRMARTELEQGGDQELQDLASAIIEAQSAEIERMDAWRERWYGAQPPAGGDPMHEGNAQAEEGMGH